MSHDRKCELDLEDASDNIINYKKLVKEQTGISVKEQMKKQEREGGENGRCAKREHPNNDKMLETNGGGGTWRQLFEG